MKLRFFLILPLCTLLADMLFSAAAEREFQVTGTVKARLDDGRVVIQHEEIPGYMAAMTMRFTPPSPSETEGLQAGDRVKFRYRVREGGSLADRFEVTAWAKPESVAAPAAPAKAQRPTRVRAGDAAPPFSLLNERNQPVSNESIRGRFTVVTFIFTRCPVPEFCPAMALKFGGIQEAVTSDASLAGSVRLLSVTLDPEFDQPDILAEYAKSVGAKPEIWNFATGEKAEVDALAKSFSVFAEFNGVTLDHTLCTALIGPDGRVIEIWRGNAWKPTEIVEVIKRTKENGKS